MSATIAVVAPLAPFPLVAGSPIRTNRLVRGLSAEFETVFVTMSHAHEPYRWTKSEVEDSLGVEVLVVGDKRSRASTRLAGRVLAPYHRAAVTEALRELVELRGVRLIQYECPHTAQNGPLPGAINVLSSHNVEHRILQSLASHEFRPPARIADELRWRELRRAERLIWKTMDLCLTVSALDAETMRRAGARRVVQIPNGVDPVERLPYARGARSGPLRALFVGLGAWAPYERGLAWFVAEVLPRVRSQRPMVLDVVGRPPERRIEADGVTYHGIVDSVVEHYRRADVVVVPVFEGSGTRLKILEAMNFGRPVVSTRLGVEGLPVRPKVHYLEADDPDLFAQSALELASRFRDGEPSLEPMLAAAKDAVSGLGWSAITRRLCDVYRTELEPALASQLTS